MTLGDRVYWDSCVFIHCIQQTPQHIRILRNITAYAEAGKITIVTSALTLAEVVKCDTTLPKSEQEQLISEFFKNSYIAVRQVDRRVSDMARGIVRDHGLKPPDAIHIATACITNVSEFNTYEQKMLGKSGSISELKAAIAIPNWVDGQIDMFDNESEC